MKPFFGSSTVGAASSFKMKHINSHTHTQTEQPTQCTILTALIPQITEVLPNLTRAEPSAVDIEPKMTNTFFINHDGYGIGTDVCAARP